MSMLEKSGWLPRLAARRSLRAGTRARPERQAREQMTADFDAVLVRHDQGVRTDAAQ